MFSYKYLKQGETGYDPSKPMTCPKCRGKSYSSEHLERVKGTKAKCPHCEHEF